MNIYKICLAVFLLVAGTGCKKWFDITPKTEMKAEVLFSSQAGFRDALIGVYALMTEPSSYGSELSMAYVDVLAQTYDNARTVAGHSYFDAAAYKYTIANEESRLLRIWKLQYKAIVNANIIISKADEKRAVFTGSNYNIIKGEALALRAYLHFDLLRLFGPSPATGLTKKAIPYADAYTNVPFEQSTVEQVMSKALKDLTDARELLKESDPYGPAKIDETVAGLGAGNRKVRMNYYAATALMARIYLYKGDKLNALAKAKEVIDSDLFPSFNPSGSIQKGDYIFESEHIFSLTISDLKTRYADLYFPEVAISTSPTQLSMRNTVLAGIFPAGLNTDYRNNWFETATSSTKRITKYSYNTLIPLIKISEMYLIAAETETTLSTAISYLNVLIVHRGLSALDIPSTSQVLLDTEIENEYRREFISEGQLFYYYKRRDRQKLPTIAQFANSEAVYTLPIPVSEIEFGNIE